MNPEKIRAHILKDYKNIGLGHYLFVEQAEKEKLIIPASEQICRAIKSEDKKYGLAMITDNKGKDKCFIFQMKKGLCNPGKVIGEMKIQG